ncbi:MAG: hypothetical protein U0441_28395 [Polyangiaceae bacterium]
MGEMVKSFPNQGIDVTPARQVPPTPAQPGDVTGQVASDAKQAASQVAEQAKELVSQKVTEKAGRGAGDIRQFAHVLRNTRGQLGDNMAAPLVDKAADQLERFSRFLQDANPERVVRDVESFARREPLLFLGGAFALGLLGARFLKSSARHPSEGWNVREHNGEEDRIGEWGSPRRNERYGYGSSRRPYGQENQPGRGANFTSRTSQENREQNRDQNRESFLKTQGQKEKGKEGNRDLNTEANMNARGVPSSGVGGGS